jgi:hypothetical protein
VPTEVLSPRALGRATWSAGSCWSGPTWRRATRGRTWWVDRDARGEGAVLVVRNLGRLAASERAAVAEQGHALMGLIVPGTGPRDVRFDPVA